MMIVPLDAAMETSFADVVEMIKSAQQNAFSTLRSCPELMGLNHRFGHSGRMACLISKVSSMRDRALRHLVQMNYSVNGQS
jgi:hypothetical protein